MIDLIFLVFPTTKPEKRGVTTEWRLPWNELASYRDPGVRRSNALFAKSSSHRSTIHVNTGTTRVHYTMTVRLGQSCFSDNQ
jgi:hypothetical protein